MSAARIEQGVGQAAGLGLRPAESTTPELSIDTSTAEVGAPDFEQILVSQVDEASRLDHVAKTKADMLARGATDDLHGTMISIKEADISMKLVGTVRNRLLDAFHELWRINL
jgi:flagellar hook-basal body complex protein FliE